MSVKSLGLDAALHDYLMRVGVRESAIMRRLRAESDALEWAVMRSSAEQVNALTLLLQLMDARRIIEIGVFTGYATLGFASVLPREGKIFALDTARDWTDIAQRYWQEAGVSDRIELILAPAGETLENLIKRGNSQSVDFVFIDADKENYDAYYEAALALLRRGGLVAIDNVLWHGNVVDESAQDADTRAIRALNAKLVDDARIDLAMLPVGDGVTLARKR